MMSFAQSHTVSLNATPSHGLVFDESLTTELMAACFLLAKSYWLDQHLKNLILNYQHFVGARR